MKKAAVLLSGCGNMDGTEIHEAVSAIIALDEAGWEMLFTAPDTAQDKTVSYITGKPIEPRNSLEEAARIARGNIVPLSPELADEVDAVVIPGGLGAALTLCDFAVQGADCSALKVVEEFLNRAVNAGKPIGAMCIAPALVARCVPGASVTVGTSEETAAQIEKMGCIHVQCPATEAVTDREKGIVTTPAYMTAAGPAEVFRGAVEMVRQLDALVSPS